MYYSDKELKTREIKAIANALDACDCIMHSEKRSRILIQLKADFPEVKVNPYDSIELIQFCQKYPGALEQLIDTIDVFYENGSKQVESLKQCAKEICSPLPPQDASLRKENGDFVVRSPTGEIIIPCRFENVGSISMCESQIYDIPIKFWFLLAENNCLATILFLSESHIIYTWKQLHTYSEILLNDYMEIYEYLLNAKRDDEIRKARDILFGFHTKSCNPFLSNIEKLDERIFFNKKIMILKFIPLGIEAALETMKEPISYEYLELGHSLIRHIKFLLFEALRLADRILDNYFRELGQTLKP
jgi:hypothetical protein